MRKAPVFTALCTLALVLTACASSTDGTTNGFGSARNSATGTLAPEAKLALGTIKLDGTAQAVDAKTAAKLLPLWQLMVQLHSSSSTAPQEVTATLDQIQATMTPDQLNTINKMSFTSADVFSLLQNQAQASNGSGAGGSRSNGFSGRNGAGGGRVFFGSGPSGFADGPGGGFRPTNGNGSSNASQLTSEQQAQARENALSSLVENQLIRLLESKLGSQPG